MDIMSINIKATYTVQSIMIWILYVHEIDSAIVFKTQKKWKTQKMNA